MNTSETSSPLGAILTPQQRSNLQQLMRELGAQLGMGPLREAARETGLLGREAKRYDAGTLKRAVADPDQLTRLVSTALQDRARQASGLRTLQRIARSAQLDPSLDSRAQTHFQRASRALEQKEWESLNRAIASLLELRAENPHSTLQIANQVILLGSGELARVLFALKEPNAVVFDTAGSRPRPPTLVADVQQPADQIDKSSAVQGRARALVGTYRESIHRALRVAQTALDIWPPQPDLHRIFVGVSESAQDSEIDAASKASTPEDFARAFRTRVERFRNQCDEAATGVAAALKAATEAQLAVEGALSQSPSDPPLLKELDARRIRLANLRDSTEAEANALLAEVDQLCASDPPVAVGFTSTGESGVRGQLNSLRALRDALVAELNHAKQIRESTPPLSPIIDQPVSDFRFLTATALDGLLSSGLPGRLREAAAREMKPLPVRFLPLTASATCVLVEAAAGTSVAELANIGATNLLLLWAHELRTGRRPIGQHLEFLQEAKRIREAVLHDKCRPVFETVVASLFLHCASEDRERSRGQRRLSQILSSDTRERLDEALAHAAEAAASSGALARITTELLSSGFGDVLVDAIVRVALRSPSDGRRLLDALAIATVVSEPEHGLECRRRVFSGLECAQLDQEAIEDHLAEIDRQSRRGTRPDVPRLASVQPLVTDFLASLAHRHWEKGRNNGGPAKVSVTIPKAALKGICVDAGTRHIEVPILVRNGAEVAAAGVSIALGRPAKGDSPIITPTVELNIPWLSDDKLDDSSSVVVAAILELDAEKLDGFRELRLSVRTSWFGGRAEETYVLPLLVGQPGVGPEGAMDGFDGTPVNLNDSKTLQLSSTSVLKSFSTIRDTLVANKPLRAYIYGRRRRGKSSICTSLRDNSSVQAVFAVQDRVWNGARMTSVETAFATLSELILSALAKVGVSGSKLHLSDLSRADELSQRFLHWFDSLADSLVERKRVLLILDEFQKWLSGLGSSQERLALLGALRHFNDRRGNLEVSFVLSGLQNLRALVQESNDLANAIEPFEIRALTNEEADRYIRERIPVELDGRARRRLVALSGGNPYVLNRLGGNLLEALGAKRRKWCTVADIDALLATDDAQTGRLNEFMKYMLHEDEDDGAASLKQLTVLRVAAMILKERGDYDGYVRVTDIETWLLKQAVPFEPGIVGHQLEELAQLDLLQLKQGGRFYLRGEWLCRSLAALDPQVVKLQPVTDKGDPDLVLRRYKRTSPLGHGGDAEVWLASNVDGGPDVVLRIYPLSTVGLRQRLEREKEILDKVRHPNVVAFHGATLDDRHGGVVVMEHIAGSTLSQLLDEDGPDASSLIHGDLRHRIELLKKLTDGVRACHQAGVVHKDLSPGNVMVQQRMGIWEPKLIDFGIAGFNTQPLGGESPTAVVGTPGYIAPEKLRSPHVRRTPAADIYSLGALFVRVLAKTEPATIKLPGPALTDLFASEKLPPRALELVQQMLADDPDKRPTADTVSIALDSVLEPATSRQLHAEAVTAFLEDRAADAERLFGQALARASTAERSGADYERLLAESLDVLTQTASVAWDSQWIQHWFSHAQSFEPTPEPKKVVQVLLAYRNLDKSSGNRLLEELLGRLADSSTVPALGPFVAMLARREELRDPAVADRTFDALAHYASEKQLEVAILEDYCVACARAARIKYQHLVGCELWLQRARRVASGKGPEYVTEARNLDEARKKSGRVQTLPLSAPHQAPFRFGEREKGHLNVDKIAKFDEAVRRRFPFVCQMQRVEKDPKLQVSRPTLMSFSNLGRHLPQGSEDPGNIIPMALDASFTGDIALRVNIILVDGTNASQREAAQQVLRAEKDLFDFHE